MTRRSPKTILPPRAEVFRSVLRQEGQLAPPWRRRADLTEPPDTELETIRRAIIRARLVVHEQRRLLDMLRRFFAGKPEWARVYRFLSRPLCFDRFTGTEAMEEYLCLADVTAQTLSDAFDLALNAYLRENFRRAIGKSGLPFPDQVYLMEKTDLAIDALHDLRNHPILAHRVGGFGGQKTFKEATAEALRHALASHVPEIEFDLRASRDHVPMVHHNATLGETAGVHHHIRQLSCNELQALRLKNGERLATLRDVFEMIGETGNEVSKIRIEIKDFDVPMIDEVVALIAEYRLEYRVKIQAWFFQILQYLYEKRPDLQYVLCYSPVIRFLSEISHRIIVLLRGYAVRGQSFFHRAMQRLRRERLRDFIRDKKVHTDASEVRQSGILFDPNLHWSALASKGAGRTDFVGVHAMTYAGLNMDERAALMTRVLQYGSINVMAMERAFYGWMRRIPLLFRAVRFIHLFFRRFTKFDIFARECEERGISVDLFGLDTPEEARYYFDRFERNGLKLGTVCCGNAKAVPSLSLH